MFNCMVHRLWTFTRNFVRRWNMGENGIDRIVHLFSKRAAQDRQKWLTEIGAWDLLAQSLKLRSGDQLKFKSFGLYRTSIWKMNLIPQMTLNCSGPAKPLACGKTAWPAGRSAPEQHPERDGELHPQYNNFIYIETQFFISGFGDWRGERRQILRNQGHGQ